jgi:hypothetical protein
VVIAAPPGGEVVPYLALGLLTIMVSGAHLGKKTRALRALLNFRTSWLSREAVFFSTFLAASAIHLGTWDLGPGQAEPLGWLIACSGFLAIFSADRVYDAVPQTNQPGMHSARVPLTVGLLLSWFLQSHPLFLTVGAAKVLLYARRKLYFYQTEKSVHTGLSFFRIVTGLLIPGALMASAMGYWMGLMLVLVGEGIDRAEFYDEFEVLTPDHQIRLDEREWTLRHTTHSAD